MAEPMRVWPSSQSTLAALGIERVHKFCAANGIDPPLVNLFTEKWAIGACAYYRPSEGINVCLPWCGRPCGHARGRNWTWPGSATDREPYGVIAHELGHHCDYLAGDQKGSYWSDYSTAVMEESGEAPITSYADNPAEWFAEMFRLFVTNHGLLKCLRPATYAIISRRYKPEGTANWRHVLGANVPDRILRTLHNKGAR